MAREIIDLVLPSGEEIEFDVDASWDDATVMRKAQEMGLYESMTVPKNTQPEFDDAPAFDEASKPETEAKGPDFSQRFTRQQELGVRAVAEGVAGFPLMIGDATNTALNFIPGVEMGMPSQIVREALPLASPETAGERMAGTVIAAGAGTAAGIGTAAKLTTGAVKRFMTEEAAQQLAVGTAAGAGVGVGMEQELGPVGLIMAGLAGGIGGGVGARQASKGFARWSDSRVLENRPISQEEVAAKLIEDGHQNVTSAELKSVRETLEELRTSQKVDAEIEKLRPQPGDPVEVARAKKRLFRVAGGDPAEATLPLIVKRERAAMQRREIGRVEAKVRALESKKVTETPVMKEVIAKESEARKQQSASGLTVDSGFTPTKMNTWGNAVISRIENVSPQLGMAVRRVSQRSATRTTDDVNTINRFYKSKELRSLRRKDQKDLDRAFLNGDRDTANLIMSKAPGLEAMYDANVGRLLADIQKIRVAGGLDGFAENFHPRAVVRLKALQHSRGKEVAGKIKTALDDATRAKAAKNGGTLTENEVAGVINQGIGGRPLKVLKDRRINEIEAGQQKYYASSRDSMIDYLHNHHNGVATRDFFKASLGADKQLGQTIDGQELGKILTKEMMAGNLTGKQLDELVPLLDAQFGISRQAGSEAARISKNLVTTGTLASPMSTLTQLGDVAPVMRKFGVGQTIKSLFGKKALDVYDVGVRELAKDERTVKGTAQMVRGGLKAVGFDKLDKIMANTGVNAAYSKWTKAAGRNPQTTLKHLQRVFGDEAPQVLGDLRNRRLTDNVKTFLFNEIGDIRPVAREDMPLSFQKHPNGRILFSLLSWTLKQMNFVRNSAMRDFKAGRKTKATGDFLKFVALMGATNGSVITVKDWIRGNDIDPGSAFVQGALSIGMSGKFALDMLERNAGAATLGAIIPFLGITFDAVQSGFNSLVNGEPAEILNAIPALRNFKAIYDSEVMEDLMVLPLVAIDAAVAKPHAQLSPRSAGQLSNERAALATGIEGARELPSEVTDQQVEALNLLKAEPQEVEPRSKKVGDQFKAAKELLVTREGDRAETYTDSEGHLTGGIGHLMTDAEAAKYPEGTTVPKNIRDAWFKKDSVKALNAARKQAKEIGRPDMVAVLTSVNFQLGEGWTKKHPSTWEFMTQRDWTSAAAEAADSLWFEQTPVRVRDLQKSLLQGIEG